MTKLLGKVFKEVSKLPDIEQNAIAKWLLEELKAEKKWDQSFAASEDVLERLANEAIEVHKRGKTVPLDIEKL
jgi:aspartate/glutamate racemase